MFPIVTNTSKRLYAVGPLLANIRNNVSVTECVLLSSRKDDASSDVTMPSSSKCGNRHFTLNNSTTRAGPAEANVMW